MYDGVTVREHGYSIKVSEICATAVRCADEMTYLGDFRVHGCCSDGGGQVGRRRAEWNANTERHHVGETRFFGQPGRRPGLFVSRHHWQISTLVHAYAR